MLSRRVWEGMGILWFWAFGILEQTGKKIGKIAHPGVLKGLVPRGFEAGFRTGKITGKFPV